MRKGYNEHPRTPDPYEKQSKRMFDGKIKAWRRLLHNWDNIKPVIVSSLPTPVAEAQSNISTREPRAVIEESADIDSVSYDLNQACIPVVDPRTSNAMDVALESSLNDEGEEDEDEDDVL